MDNKIAEFIKEVDLGSMLDRVGGLDTPVGWNWQVHVSLEILYNEAQVNLNFLCEREV